MTKEMFEEITGWQRKVFTKANAQSAASHLKEEVNELLHDLTWSKPMEQTVKEYADCFLLLFGSASLYGLTYEDICRIINEKMEINKQRKWGEVNKEGYVKHITLKRGDVVYLKDDLKKEPYTVKQYTDEISRGPNRQFNPSPVILVADAKSREWRFREDSLQLEKDAENLVSMNTGVKKKNWKLAAEVKTIADYALILQHINGYDKEDCIRLASDSAGETLFELLRERNEELFKTGSIAMIDAMKTERTSE